MSIDEGTTDVVAEYPTRIRLLFCVVVAALGAFTLCAVVYNMPESTVKTRIGPVVNAAAGPWFDQDWHLFAPTPGTSNTHLLVSAQIRASDGSIVEAPALDVQDPLDDLVKANRVLPTKLPSLTLRAQNSMTDYARELAGILRAPPERRPEMHAQLDQRYQVTLDQLRRFFSRCAQDRLGPAARIIAVRGIFTDTPLTPFSRRYEANPPPFPTKTIVTTSWAPFVADVGR